jgi:hypothetical protein
MRIGVRLAAGVEVGSMVMVGRLVASGMGVGLLGRSLVVVAPGFAVISVGLAAAGPHPASRQVNIRPMAILVFMAAR